jgi:hypothetical protein
MKPLVASSETDNDGLSGKAESLELEVDKK